jgi:hypothetical protein
MKKTLVILATFILLALISFTFISAALPPVTVYKTKSNYTNLVPIGLSEDKARIASYPGTGDVYYSGKLAYPTELNQGYLLDHRGIGKNTAFLNITYERYSQLERTPSLTELFNLILDNDPFLEIYDCTNTYIDPTGPGATEKLNEIINNGTLNEKCIVVVKKTNESIACTMDAKLCPDGSYVSRNSSNGCQFNPCPSVDSCNTVTPIYQDRCCVSKGYDYWSYEKQTCMTGCKYICHLYCPNGYVEGSCGCKCIEITANYTEHPILGASCGTVTPGYQNECCVSRGYKTWNNKEWKCTNNTESNNNETEDNGVVCTMDAKMCPDGTSVGRSGPNCEFKCPIQYNISREKVCCKVYGYGAEMNETNVRYKITDKKECAIPENFVGGNREIVNKSYCIEQIQENREEFLEKKWEIMQEKNKIKSNYLTQAECPDNCSCSGSTIKCEFENGTRVMTVTAGNSGNVLVQVKNINASTNVTLYKSEEKVYGVFKNNETHEIILPDEVKERIKEREQNREGKRINWTDENITLNETGYYHIQAHKKARLFWLVPVKERVQYEVNSETGEITKTKTRWWGFLARDVRENSTSQ